jgi:enoyl-CoA hydratase
MKDLDKSPPQGDSGVRKPPGGAVCRRTGAAAVLTLDRPDALNALTTVMRATIATELGRAARDSNMYAVVLKSADPRAFCAGGDIREMAALAAADRAAARRALAAEYALNWRLECFSKPHVALIDGLVMGSGVGISLYGTHRVAGPAYRFAMPETAIGLFPDDGVIHAFSRMTGEVGTYLALTGRRIGRADALALGLVTHCIGPDAFAEIENRLAAAEPVDRILDGLHDAGREPEELPPLHGVIARCFAGHSVAGIIGKLEAERGAHAAWARAVFVELARRAPLSLAVTLRHLREAAAMDLRQTLAVDYRLACKCLDRPDFAEGVRAALVDKDRAPRWMPSRIGDVTPGMIDRMFEADPADALVLPTRQEMQSARA